MNIYVTVNHKQKAVSNDEKTSSNLRQDKRQRSEVPAPKKEPSKAEQKSQKLSRVFGLISLAYASVYGPLLVADAVLFPLMNKAYKYQAKLGQDQYGMSGD